MNLRFKLTNRQVRSVRRELYGGASKIVPRIPNGPLRGGLGAFVLSLVLFVAHAQETAPAPSPIQTSATTGPAEASELPPITVTGYIIPRLGEGTQPVFTLDRDWWEKRGQKNLADILETLPFANGNLNQTFAPGNNTSPGGDAVNLHGIGIGYTLVLADGLRFPLFPLFVGSQASFVDLNSIPLAAVDRIEILKDNGTSTYGDDAVAGVINIILKDTYNGAQVNNYVGFSQRGDDVTYNSQLVGGIAEDLCRFGKLSIVTAFNYWENTPIDATDRPFTNGERSLLSPKYPNRPVTFPPTYLSSFFGVDTGSFYTVIPGTRTGPTTSLTTAPIASPIFAPLNNQLFPREERWGGLVKVNYSPTDWLKLYDAFLIQDNHETASTANQGYDFGGSQLIFGQPIVVPTTNLYNTTGEPLIPLGGWGGDFPQWTSNTWVRTLRNEMGALVQLPRNWIIEGIFNYGESDATESFDNAVNLVALQEAFNGTLPGHTGQFYNPFLDWRAVQGFNKVFYPSLLVNQTLDSRTDLVQWVLKTGGTLLDLWSGPLNVAAGLEYRSESLIQANDQLSELNLIGNGNFLGKQASGRRYVRSAYWEVDLPLAGDKWSWPGLRALDFTYSERYDDYSTVGGASKPKFALRYKPFNDFTLRAAYSEGYRGPSLLELFASPSEFPFTITDPNFPASDPRHTYTTLVVQGGNPNLRPQVAYSYFLEGVWVPDSVNDLDGWFHWLHGFTAYLDWFQIEVHNRIGLTNSQFVVDAPTAFPGASIVRSPVTGQIVQINNPFINLATSNTRGIDFGGSYITKEYYWGRIDFELNATYVYGDSGKIIYPPINGRPVFQVVTFDDQAEPDFKLVASLFYSKTICFIDTFRTGLTLNYLDSEADFNNNGKGSNPLANATLDAPGYVHLIGNWTTLDYQISYEFGEPEEITPGNAKPGYNKEGNRLFGEKAIAPKPVGSRWGWRQFLANTKFIFGINNIFDTRPPLSVDATYPLGRDTGNVNSVQRFFYIEIDKHF